MHFFYQQGPEHSPTNTQITSLITFGQHDLTCKVMKALYVASAFLRPIVYFFPNAIQAFELDTS